jgi:uncharacterized protein involved in outer membrane biogenesis
VPQRVVSATPLKSPPRRRRIGVAVLALAGLLLLGLVVGEALGWPWLRGPLERRLTAAAGVAVRLEGAFSLHLWPQPRLAVQRLHVASAPPLALPHLVQADEVALVLPWRALWDWRGGQALRLRSVSAAALDANLVRDEAGRASWRLGASRENNGTPDRRDSGADAAAPQIESLRVRQGRVHWRDAPRSVDLVLAIGSDDAGRWRGNLQGRYRELPLDLRLQSDALLPLLARDGPTPVALRVDGQAGSARVGFDGRVAALLDARRLDGRLQVQGPSLAGVGRPLGITLPNTPPFQLQGRLQHEALRWSLTGARVEMGSSRFGGDFHYDRGPQPPLLSAQVAGARLALPDLGPAIGAGAGRSDDARVLPRRRFDLPALKAMAADVSLRFDELVLGSARLAPLQAVQARLRLADGVLHIDDLDARVAGGRVRGDTSLDSRATPARWQAKLRMTQVDFARWWRGGDTPGRGRVPPLAGTLEADVDVQGRGVSTATLLSNLDGKVNARLSDGALSHLVTEGIGLDVAQALGVLVRGDRPLPLRCAVLDLAVQDGRVAVRRGVLDNRDSTIRIGGRVNLREESLELVLRSRPKDFSPLSLRSPVTLTGRFDAPRVGIDGSRLAGRVAGGVLLGAVVGPVAALLPLVDPGERQKQDPCTASRAGS